MNLRALVTGTTLLVFSAASTASAAAPAMLNSAGNVQVNGRYVPATTPVFAGDRIETSEKSVGNVSIQDTLINIQRASRVAFGKDSFEILSGGAKVKTSHSYGTTALGISIKPKNGAAEYMVVNQGTKVFVAAMSGDLLVGAKLTVPAGRSVTLNATTAAASPKPQTSCVDGKKVDENGKFLLDNLGRYISCIDQTTTGGGPIVDTTAGGVSPKVVAVGVGAAGAAGAGAAIWIANNDKAPTSPAVP